MSKRQARKDPELYERFARAHDHCQACGIGAHLASRIRWPGLSRHHVIKHGRSDERCNLLMLCQRCHSLAEGLLITLGGLTLPTLPLAVCLTIKATREPLAHDPARLAVLRGSPLPAPRPIPAVIETEYRRRRPRSFLLFARDTPGQV